MGGTWNASTDKIEPGTWNVGAIQAFTISLWVYVDAFTVTDARFISKASGTNTADHDWMLGQVFSSSNQRWRVRLKAGGTTDTFVGDSVMASGQWYHAHVDYDGTDVSLFVDDVEEANDFTTSHSVGGNMDTSLKAIQIGNNAGGSKGLSGGLADVTVLSSSLTAAQRGALVRGVHIFGMVPISEAHWPIWANITPNAQEFSDNVRIGGMTSIDHRAHPPIELLENYL